MDPLYARVLCENEMKKWGLSGWRFEWGRSKDYAGTCYFVTKRIVLSRPYVEIMSRDRVLNTVLHEIAHALAGRTAGHGPKWQKQAIKVGADPNRLIPLTPAESEAIFARSKYIKSCEKGCDLGTANRLPNRKAKRYSVCAEHMDPVVWRERTTGQIRQIGYRRA